MIGKDLIVIGLIALMYEYLSSASCGLIQDAPHKFNLIWIFAIVLSGIFPQQSG